ncbi:MAG: hypothetical protein AB7F35_28600 [Acetobacteraceae bacterium]
MNHNLSRRAAREAVLANPLSRYAHCVLAVTCPKCRERRELRIAPFLTDTNREEPVRHSITRLRCAICGSPPEIVRLQRRAGQGRPSQEIPILGLGSD